MDENTQKHWESLDGETLLQELQQFCTEQGISDIHTSPEEGRVRLEIRLHGVLNLLGFVTEATYITFVRRVKFLSKLKLNITNIPQDGQYTFDAPGRTVNVRVATVPSRFGEAMTLRLLDPQKGLVPLEKLGLNDTLSKDLKEIMEMPHGLLLVTGPTGSGKTTTLYALLQTVVGTNRNIVTLEDPIEYELPGVIQSEIDPDHDYTFASGLRSVLRHDPDIILVGEIRDPETAQTAIDASLTGHLVLSTLHTNSSLEAIPRLLSMGVSPYTFAPAIKGVLAQRLVRTVKPELRGKDYDPNASESYNGQIAVAEFLKVTPAIQKLILNNEVEDKLLEAAQSEGFRSMKQYAEELVKDGLTSEEEIKRVVS